MAGKRGRPTKKTPAVLDQIVERLSEGEPLAQICREDTMPGLSTVYEWLEEDREFSGRFARARAAGFDMIAQEALRIADTPVDGMVEKLERVRVGQTDETELQVVERRREDMLGHRKLQVETRLKLLAKWDPKRYGDLIRQELTGKDGGPIQAEDVTKRDADEFASRILRLAAGAGTGQGAGEASGGGKG